MRDRSDDRSPARSVLQLRPLAQEDGCRRPRHTREISQMSNRKAQLRQAYRKVRAEQ